MAYATAAEAKTRQDRLATVSDTLIDDAIAEFAVLAERYCGDVFGSRSVTYDIAARPLPAALQLRTGNVSAVTLTCDGTAVDMTRVIVGAAAGTLARIPWPTVWPTTASVAYTAGLAVPVGIKRVACQYAAEVLGSEGSGMSRDVRWQGSDGAVSFVTPDWDRGRPTGWTEIDRVLNEHRQANGFA